MQQILLLESQSVLLKNHFCYQSITVPEFSLCNKGISSITFPWKIRTSHLCHRSSNLSDLNFPSLTPQRELKRSTKIFAVRKNRRQPGWRRSGKEAIECALLIASNLKFLPEPMNLIIREGFGSGNGGGFGSWNGFGGGGGFEGWWGRKRNLGFLKFLLGVCVLILLFIFRKEFEGLGDMGIGVVGLFLLGVVERDWKRGIRGWIFGFCSCALMVFLGLRREELQKWVQGFRVRSPIMEFVRRRRRWRRKAL
ncbi:hypothetical protein BVC80_9037g46 [Macleaya cordata]|uniref:Transmembrane protein n=1 Tax=Macleaya cordata TaxID=56857 RepID=A0A200Q5M5_MACCD|nr:hypothetical protein BVC80_9037g46 [Macleaya cordata]